ncbi:hypothetical protein [Saccharothrix deserti]|uniref:hypothetical protein n=1 Tax=Saccharothrix deserti TaxID=2593674 RepID=UPI00131E7928|nr:hypothetical protein [Saccharothrix deserti]
METKREWLIRCTDRKNEPSVCSIAVSGGIVEIWDTNGHVIKLGGTEIADFRTMFAEAAERAAQDEGMFQSS